MSKNKLPKISDEDYKIFLFKHLEEKNDLAHQKTTFYDLIRVLHSMGKSRSVKLHDKYYSEWLNLREEVNKEVTVTRLKESAENGLEIKTDRIINLQKWRNDIQKDLDSEDGLEVGNDGVGEKRKSLTKLEKARMREIMAKIQMDISILEGDKPPKEINLKGRLQYEPTIETVEEAKDYLKKLDEI